MLRATLLEAGIAEDRILVRPDAHEAVETALGLARAVDLVMIFGYVIKG